MNEQLASLSSKLKLREPQRTGYSLSVVDHFLRSAVPDFAAYQPHRHGHRN